MKHTLHHTFLLGTFLAGLACQPLLSQEEEKEKPKLKHLGLLDEQVVEEVHLPESLQNAMTGPPGTWWATHYVQGLGLSLFDKGIVPVPKPVFNSDAPANTKQVSGAQYVDGKLNL